MIRTIINKLNTLFSEPSENQSLFYWFHKGLGLIYLSAIFPVFFQIQVLIGEDGLLPASTLLKMSYDQQGIVRSFLQFPSLFHFLPNDTTLYVLVTLGCLGAVMLLFGFKIFWGALMSWVSFLSLTTIGGDFFVIIIDLFLAELGFLALFSTYYQIKNGAVPRIVDFAFRLLNFRLWFCMGVNKFYLPLDVWKDFSFFDYYFHAQPMPSPLAPFFHGVPVFFKYLAHAGMFVSEIIVPFFVFGGRRLRLISFFTFLIISVLIQISGNFGYFNVLSIVLALLILKDGDLIWIARKTNPINSVESNGIFKPIKLILLYQLSMQLLYCIYVFHPRPYCHQNQFNTFFTSREPENVWLRKLLTPFKYPEYWRICNPYGVFKGIPYNHAEIRLSGSSHGEAWQTYEFNYLPSGYTDHLGFFAPYYPRLDHLFFYETISAQNYKWNPLNRFYTQENNWYCNFIRKLLDNDSKTSALLKNNPFEGKEGPKWIRAEVFKLRFSVEKNKNWENETVGIVKIYSKENPCHGSVMTNEEALRVTYSREE